MYLCTMTLLKNYQSISEVCYYTNGVDAFWFDFHRYHERWREIHLKRHSVSTAASFHSRERFLNSSDQQRGLEVIESLASNLSQENAHARSYVPQEMQLNQNRETS